MNKKRSSFNIFKNKKLMVLFIAGLGLSFVIFGPITSKLKLRLKTNKTLVAEKAKLKIKLEFLEGIDKVLINKRVLKMETVFPSKKPVVPLMGSLSRLAMDYNLSFGGITLRPGVLGEEDEKSPSGLKDMKFGFKVGGNFDNLALFMKNLEKMAPLMKIDKLSLSIKSNPFFEETSLNVVADIEVLAYYQAPPKTLGSVSKEVNLLDKKDEFLLNRLFSFKTFEAVLPVAPTGKVDLFSLDLQGLP
ncbi:MAG: hypothetical protein U9Q63_02225 [Patescibacteria group bacterium]|nr:hypothetical protein [Patescibacteria group bacterium]